MKIKTFNQFIVESWEDVKKDVSKRVAGVAIIYDNNILLVHPTNASWKVGNLGIPKGRIEEGEDETSAALRELYEETGIEISKEDLKGEPYTVDSLDKDGNIEKQLIYFLHEIKDLSEIGLIKNRVPKENLQIEEVDWAGFLSPKEAYPKMSRSQLILLDRHLNI
jgi:8-oxo-dGTP pyrophosphatase MutT (NUDIX family)